MSIICVTSLPRCYPHIKTHVRKSAKTLDVLLSEPDALRALQLYGSDLAGQDRDIAKQCECRLSVA